MDRRNAQPAGPSAGTLALLIAGLIALALVAEHVAHSWEQPAWIPIADIGIGWLMAGCGMAAMRTWPGQPAGARLVLAGALWFVGTFQGADDPVLRGLGFAFGGYHDPVLLLLALSFPGRWPTGRAVRGLTLSILAISAMQTIARLVMSAPSAVGVNLLDPDLALAIVARIDIVRGAVMVAGGAVALARLLGLPRGRRGDRGLVLAAGAASAVASGWNAYYAMTVVGLLSRLGEPYEVPVAWAFNLVRIIVPLAILAGVMRARASRTAMAAAVASVGAASSTSDLRAALATAMRDPGLELLVWDGRAYRGEGGGSVSPVEADAAQAAGQLLRVDGDGSTRLAAIQITQPTPDPSLVESGVALTRLVVENMRLAGQVRDQLEDVRASRTRIVEAAADERRRIERDLHDGLQQRMVALALQLQASGPSAADRDQALREGAAEVLAILEEVRELARGIHPPVLVQSGLGPAIRAIADRSPIPAEVHLELSGAGSAAAQATAYFVVSEALANSAKHASSATTVWIDARDDTGSIRVVIDDDGPGGADAAGSGLRGLADRVAGLGGSFAVETRPGGGTRVTAEIPA